MNCEGFQTVVSELAVARASCAWSTGETAMTHSIMAAPERTAAMAHAAECRSCAFVLEDERNLIGNLRSLAHEMKSLSAPPRLEEKLLAAFRERSNVAPVIVPFPGRRHQTRNLIAAIAAALLIVCGIFVVRARFLSRAEPQFALTDPKTKASTPKESLLASSALEPPRLVNNTNKPATGLVPGKRPASYLTASHRPKAVTQKNIDVPSASTSAAGANSGEQSVEVATAFFPIGYGNTPPNLQEGGQLLRVELPRAAVARFGLPVNMDRAGERVKADVFVGADGLAQAIRFVH